MFTPIAHLIPRGQEIAQDTQRRFLERKESAALVQELLGMKVEPGNVISEIGRVSNLKKRMKLLCHCAQDACLCGHSVPTSDVNSKEYVLPLCMSV